MADIKHLRDLLTYHDELQRILDLPDSAEWRVSFEEGKAIGVHCQVPMPVPEPKTNAEAVEEVLKKALGTKAEEPLLRLRATFASITLIVREPTTGHSFQLRLDEPRSVTDLLTRFEDAATKLRPKGKKHPWVKGCP